jgi:hypothetical protein
MIDIMSIEVINLRLGVLYGQQDFASVQIASSCHLRLSVTRRWLIMSPFLQEAGENTWL